MAKSNEANENYIHSCGESTKKIENHIASITTSNLSDSELKRVLDFFLFSPLILKDKNSKTGKQGKFGCRLLADLGWGGQRKLNELERKLLKVANISNFCFLGSKSMTETLKNMGLEKDICIHHARAVLMQETSMEMMEDGSIKTTKKENRMVCLFRHIRNAIAHNRTYIFTDVDENDTIMFEDEDTSGKITARILLKTKSLVDWINVVEKINMTTSIETVNSIKIDENKIAS